MPEISQAPVSDNTTKQLTQIWQEILGVDSITPDQNYFDLGGDSSVAVQLFAQIDKVFGVKLPLATLFDAPTIEELARVLRQEEAPAGWSPLVPIQTSGSRPPFFCIHGAGGNVLIYRELAERLGPDQPFYGLQAVGLDASRPPLTRIEDMATAYAKEIRRKQPHGPYFLGGYCMGGTVAYEIAQQLQAQGERVALLALFDTDGVVQNSAAFDLGQELPWRGTPCISRCQFFPPGWRRQVPVSSRETGDTAQPASRLAGNAAREVHQLVARGCLRIFAAREHLANERPRLRAIRPAAVCRNRHGFSSFEAISDARQGRMRNGTGWRREDNKSSYFPPIPRECLSNRSFATWRMA